STLGGPQLVPHWATAPWIFSTTAGLPIDQALSQAWPIPKVRPLSKPHADMMGQLYDGNPDVAAINDLARIAPDGKLTDRHLRYVIWFAAVGFDSLFIDIPLRPGRYESQFSRFPF